MCLGINSRKEEGTFCPFQLTGKHPLEDAEVTPSSGVSSVRVTLSNCQIFFTGRSKLQLLTNTLDSTESSSKIRCAYVITGYHPGRFSHKENPGGGLVSRSTSKENGTCQATSSSPLFYRDSSLVDGAAEITTHLGSLQSQLQRTQGDDPHGEGSTPGSVHDLSRQ